MSITIEKSIEGWTNTLRQLKIKADIVFFGDSLTYSIFGDGSDDQKRKSKVQSTSKAR